MVALQILVLIVGVRILLGELKADYCKSAFYLQLHRFGSFEYRFSSSPSQGGETGSTPVGAIFRKLSLYYIESFFFTPYRPLQPFEQLKCLLCTSYPR